MALIGRMKTVESTTAEMVAVTTGDEWRQCCDCNSTWCLTGPDRAFFLGKGLSLPRRCRDCRQANKARRGGPWLRQNQGPFD